MPLYEYDCPECGRFEKIQKFSDSPLKECPQCKEKGKSVKVRRLISEGSFHLKGGGWYKSDYTPSKSSSIKDAPKESKSDSTSSEKKATPCGSNCACH